MKLKTKNSEYGHKNATLTVSNDQSVVSAYSYGWWKFVATDKTGNVYFNNTNYSPSTGQHQSKIRRILSRLGIRVSLTLNNTQCTMRDGIGRVIRDEVDSLKNQNKNLLEATKQKGSWKKTNKDRLTTIENNEYRIKDLRRVIKDNLDKALIPQSTKLPTIKEVCTEDYDNTIDRHTVKKINKLKQYYKKPNGKIQWDLIRAFIGKYSSNQYYWNVSEVPESIERLKEVLELKASDSIEFILAYEFSKDLGPMVPEVDSKEYKQLKAWIKGLNHPNNILLLDKMHTYLTNKLNRKEYVPSEPTPLPVHPRLQSLKGTEGLRLVTNDRELKAEGRKQSHCIGAKQYIDGCIGGNQVVNYKGYTFYLNNNLRLIETHGRFNESTPQKLMTELGELLAA